jgi:hypothetical protein
MCVCMMGEVLSKSVIVNVGCKTFGCYRLSYINNDIII